MYDYMITETGVFSCMGSAGSTRRAETETPKPEEEAEGVAAAPSDEAAEAATAAPSDATASAAIVEYQARVDHARSELPLGSRHLLDSGQCGVVRYVGPAPGSLASGCEGDSAFHACGHAYVFLELDAPTGNSSGIVGGVTLVEGLQPKHGFFGERRCVVAPAPALADLHQASREISAEDGAPAKIVRMQTLARQRRAHRKVHAKRVALAAAREYDFHKVDAHALKAPASARKSLESMADYLCDPFRDEPVKMARSIFRWCCENIEYDMSTYHGESRCSQAPGDVLATGKAVCAGYAGVMLSLCSLAGVPCVELSGCSKAASYRLGMTADELNPNHAWNAVHLDGRWQFLETTWAAGHCDDHVFTREFDDTWWLTPPADFLYKHFPCSVRGLKRLPASLEHPGSDPSAWQLLDRGIDGGRQPVSKTTWAKMAQVRPLFFRYGLAFNPDSKSSRNTIEHHGSEALRLSFTVPVGVKLTSNVKRQTRGGGHHKSKRGSRPAASSVTTRDAPNSDHVSVHVKFESEGAYVVNFFGKQASAPTSTRGRFLHAVLVKVKADGITAGGLPLDVRDAAAAAGLKGMSHPNDLIDHGASEQPLRVTLLCPRALALLTKLEAAAKTKGGGKRKLQDATVCVRDPDMPDRMHVYAKFPAAGAYTLEVYCKPREDAGSYSLALRYMVVVQTPTVGQMLTPTIYKTASEIFSECFAIVSPPPWQGGLKQGTTVEEFEVICRAGAGEPSRKLRLNIMGQWGDYLVNDGNGVWRTKGVSIPALAAGKDPDRGVGLYCTEGGDGSWHGLCKWGVTET